MWAYRAFRFFGYWSLAIVLLTNLIAMLDGSDPHGRAVLWMGTGLAMIWVLGFGLVIPRLKPWFTSFRCKRHWQRNFVLGCTLLALLEEAVTTLMTNLAPLFGSTPERAHITASTNYVHVVLFSSVSVFVPAYFAWAWMLRRVRFQPLEVAAIYGLSGMVAETVFMNPASLLQGIWIFVYGWMVYLPAFMVPEIPDRQAPRTVHYLAAFLIALIVPIPMVLIVLQVREALGVFMYR